MTVSLKLSDDDLGLIRAYAQGHGLSLNEFLRRAALEKIEDEIDLCAAEEAYDEFVKGGEVSRPISELWSELGL